MKYEDIQYSKEEIQEILRTKAKKFVDEFLKNDVYIFRKINTNSEIITTKTISKRKIIGNMNKSPAVLDSFMKKAGFSSRIENAVMGCSYDHSKIAVFSQYTYYLIPLGDYTYTYLKDLSYDFNYLTNEKMLSILRSMKIIARVIPEEDILRLVEMKSFDRIKNIKEHIKYYVDENDIDDDAEIIELHFQIINKLSTKSVIDKIFCNNDISPLKNNAVEVWFNCKEYMLINYDDYNIRELI